MTTSFPTNIDSLANPGPSDSEVTVSHSGQHSNANDAIEAIETKLGTDAQETAANVATTRGKLQSHINTHPSGISTITKGGTIVAPTGALSVAVFRAPFACTVTAVRAFCKTVGATPCVVNANRRVDSATVATLCSSNVSVTANNTWTSGTGLQNTAFSVGHTLEVSYISGTPPAQVSIQVEYTVP